MWNDDKTVWTNLSCEPPSASLGTRWLYGTQLYAWNGEVWVTVSPASQYLGAEPKLHDLLVDISKKLEKTNTLLARIENAVQCLEESTKPKPPAKHFNMGDF